MSKNPNLSYNISGCLKLRFDDYAVILNKLSDKYSFSETKPLFLIGCGLNGENAASASSFILALSGADVIYAENLAFPDFSGTVKRYGCDVGLYIIKQKENFVVKLSESVSLGKDKISEKKTKRLLFDVESFPKTGKIDIIIHKKTVNLYKEI